MKTGTNLGDEGLKEILDPLKTHPTLTSLYLGSVQKNNFGGVQGEEQIVNKFFK